MVIAAGLVTAAYSGMKKVKNADKPSFAQDIYVNLHTVNSVLSKEKTRTYQKSEV